MNDVNFKISQIGTKNVYLEAWYVVFNLYNHECVGDLGDFHSMKMNCLPMDNANNRLAEPSNGYHLAVALRHPIKAYVLPLIGTITGSK